MRNKLKTVTATLVTFFCNAAVASESLTEDRKFYLMAVAIGAIIAALITAVSAIVTNYFNNKSQGKILDATIKNNRDLQNEKIKQDSLLIILQILSSIKFQFSTTSSYMNATARDISTFRKSFVDASIEMRKAEALVKFYFPELRKGMQSLIKPMEEFWISSENHIDANSEDNKTIARENAFRATKELNVQLDEIDKITQKIIVDWK